MSQSGQNFSASAQCVIFSYKWGTKVEQSKEKPLFTQNREVRRVHLASLTNRIQIITAKVTFSNKLFIFSTAFSNRPRLTLKMQNMHGVL
jgi:hypothetical protein